MNAKMRGLGVVVAALVVLAGMQARGYYDPGIQRWINRDPMHEGGGVNLYRFTKNSPGGNLDAFGKVTIVVPPAVPVIIAGGVGVVLGLCFNHWACNRHRDLTLAWAEGEANRNAPDGSTHRGTGAVPGNDADMLTHCIATCSLARDPGQCGGPDGALAAMQAREVGTDPGTAIDRLNNGVGSGVAVNAQYKGMTCTAACLDALNDGLLYTVVNGRPVLSPRRER
jgi:RHS repeat-associated protein